MTDNFVLDDKEFATSIDALHQLEHFINEAASYNKHVLSIIESNKHDNPISEDIGQNFSQLQSIMTEKLTHNAQSLGESGEEVKKSSKLLKSFTESVSTSVKSAVSKLGKIGHK